ncbi:4-hydroxybenzoate octaprenyltransferase [Catenovulum sp. 2E275]|uniref:4-hydroxybenzoate octaprenyltransferase n=1 Tax=Catenovulum sp. 2E275 TaxID=2980497 RepID=UPI0021D015D5|nr:4-hydroxybenzoate octaprenyltransferase [Catenovulum sp. 2E275]MCU4674355.1 4-hydroxybenzoate octaprenyltransferase [Catenovulum sp. 2E275]
MNNQTMKFSEKLIAYCQLMRIDRPIGTYLLLWPTLWALWIASEGVPKLDLFIIFVLGVFVMRAAGCVINDFADRKVDGHVKRTKNRPLATGKVSSKEALMLFLGLVIVSFGLVLLLNQQTILLSFVGLGLATLYPFMKRYTHLPQVVLGAAFSWAIPMAYMAVKAELALIVWVLFFTNLAWTVAYDTLYAMVDRDDDLKIGVKSTAILFGRFDKLAVFILHVLTITGLIWAGQLAQLGAIYYQTVGLALALFIYQQWQIRHRERDVCFKAFLQNHYAGLVVLIGIILSYGTA